MKVTVNGSSITLGKNNFLASGGEGEIYTKNRIAYKIYQKPERMIPAGKMQELSAIKNPNVIRPQDPILNTKNKPIGYTMRFVPDTYALCQLFTKAFRNRNNLTHDQMQKLIKKLYGIVSDVHQAGVLIVDLNEMNFLSSKDFEEIYAIDTDSYQTRSYPATAIMDSIKDRHSKKFSKDTDWFSYGIISFQMFTGIHPYKGRHKNIKNIDERMQKNISVFNSDVSVPKACYPFDVIPEVYRNWYKAVFDDGKRLPPPSDFNTVEVTVRVDIVRGTNNIDVELLQECQGNIIEAVYMNGMKVLTDKVLELTPHKKTPVSPSGVYFFKTPSGTPLLAKLNNESLKILNPDSKEDVKSSISGQSLMTYDGSLYIKANDKILFADVIEVGKNIIVSSKIAATVLEGASKFFDGVLIQNLLGSFYVSIFPESGVHYQIHMKELDSHRVLDAKYDSGVLMVVILDRSGKYDRLVFRFDKNFSTYDVRRVDGITPVGLNFCTLDNGIVVCVNEDDNLEVFSSKKDSSGLKIVQDKTISSDMKLFKSGSKLLFTKQNKLYSARMK